MEKLTVTEGVQFLWNDVACIGDDNCAFVICKSMVKLPQRVPEIALVTMVEVAEISRALHRVEAGGQEIAGDILLRIGYETTQGAQETLVLSVPYCGDYEGTMERSNTPQVVYVNGQAVGFSNILLETVMAVPNGSRLLRDDAVIIGEFQTRQQVRPADPWPGPEQIIGTQVGYRVADYSVSEGKLQLAGQQEIGIVYAGNQPGGEKVMYYQTEMPFAAEFPMSLALAEDAPLAVGYYSLTAQIIDEQGILVDGNCTVRTQPEFVGEQAEQSLEADPVAAAKTVPAATVAQRMMMSGHQRPSKRDNLLKYMRNLDRGVNSPQCTRNIALGHQKGGTERKD